MIKRIAGGNRFIRRLLYDYPLRKKLNILVLFVTIIPILLQGTIQAIYSINNTLRESRASLERNMEKTAGLMEQYFNHILNISDKIAINRSVQDALLKPCEAPLSYLERNRYIASIIDPILDGYWASAINDDIPLSVSSKDLYVSFYVKREDIANANFVEMGQSFFDLRVVSTIEDEPWYKELDREPIWLIGYVGKDPNRDFPVISVTRNFSHVRTQREIGVLSVEVQLQAFMNFFTRINQGQMAILLNGAELIAQSDIQAGESLIEQIVNLNDETMIWDGNTPYSVFSVVLQSTGWQMVFLNNDGQLMKILRDNIIFTTLVCLGCFFSVIGLMLLLTRNVTARLSALTMKMQQIDAQLREPNCSIEGEDEFGQLDRRFYEMICKLNDLMVEKQDQARLNSLMKAELLQQQVNPHLLYNSLSAIRYLATENDAEEIGVITNMLIRFYRNSLNQGDVFFHIEDELEITRDFIQLMCRVYQLEIDVNIYVEEGLLKARCLKLILQPVIENSLMHGLRTIQRQGELRISVYRKEGIEMQVYDNGLGIERGQLQEILEKPPKGFGLRSVDGRIKLYYGQPYGLFIKTEQGCYTCVTIRIPEQYMSEITD